MTDFEQAPAISPNAVPDGLGHQGCPASSEVNPAPGAGEEGPTTSADPVHMAAKDGNPEPKIKPKDAYSYGREEHDWYTEPRWVVDLLIDAERYQGAVWDPAGGHGTIKRAFAAINHPIKSTDIVDRPGALGGIDFLQATEGREQMVDHIVCNPPFSLTESFVLKAMRMARQSAAFLVPMKWLNSQTRYDFFAEHGRPARVYVLSNRASMPPGRFLGQDGRFACDDPEPHPTKGPRWKKGDLPGGGAIDYCWVVFVPGYGGPTDLRWLSKGSSARPYKPGRPRKSAPESALGGRHG